MVQIVQKVKLFIIHLLNRIPTKLPQGLTAFEAWAASIVKDYGMPDNESMRFALAVSILHLPSTASHVPKHFFGKTLMKGAASQVAGGIMQDLKQKQAEAQAAAAQVLNQIQVAADTTPEVVAANAQTVQKN